MSRWAKAGIFSLIIQVFIFQVISKQTQWIESWYIPYIFTPLSKTLNTLTRWTHLSVGLLLAFGLGLVLVLVFSRKVVGIFRRSYSVKKLLLNTLAWISPVYLYYMLTWGLLYHRQPVSSSFALDTTQIRTEELIDLGEFLVESTNEVRREIPDQRLDTIRFETMVKEASESFGFLPENIRIKKNLMAKRASGSTLLAYMGTAGIYTFWSGESNVNKIIATHEIPEVMLHEMAHQLGFASEDEASFLSWMAGKDHPDKLFQYSVKSGVMWRALRQIYQVDSVSAKAISAKIDSTVIRDAQLSLERWKPYRGLIQNSIITPIYNTFLKANGKEEGIKAYDQMIDLVIFERRRSAALLN